MTRLLLFMTAIAVLAVGPIARGGNVDLSTVPARDSVQLTIYNAEDITLVRETRAITVKRGLNPLQFSWANTLIDSSSVQLKFLDDRDGLELLDTTFPHDRPQLLEWTVQSEFDGEASVEISYFTSGITWAADYLCISDAAQEKLSFQGFVRVFNNSGEDYADAQVRLVVGTINLVEKIAELAQRGIVSQEAVEAFTRNRQLDADDKVYLGVELRKSLQAGGGGGSGGGADEKQIVKEGLSEYFIYAIEGTETVRNGWSKRLRLFDGAACPFRVEYRYRPFEYGEGLMRLFLLRNDEASSLGSTPLPDGMVRLFEDNGRDGLALLAQQAIPYVPIGQEIELNLGPDPEVIHERVLMQSARENLWFKREKDARLFSPTEGDRVEPTHEVAGWDDRQQFVERVRNYRDKPAKVEIRLTIPGDVVFRSDLGPALHDFQSPQFSAVIEPRQRRDLAYELITRQGANARQNRVELLER
jgi:hypothetical protein